MTSISPNIPLRRLPRLVVRLAGARTMTFLVLGAVAGLGQSWVDIVLSAYLSLFVASVGLMSAATAPQASFLPHGSPLAISLGLLTSGVVRSVFMYLVGECSIFGMEGVNTRLRLLTLKRLLDVGRRQSPTPAADTMLRIDQIYPHTVVGMAAVIQLAASFVQAATLFVFVLVLAPREAVAGVIGLGVVGLFLWQLGKGIHRHMAGLPAQYTRVASGLERITRNQLLIRVLRTEAVEFPRLKGLIIEAYKRYVAALSLGNVLAALPQACGVLLVVVIIQLNQTFWHTPGAVLLSFIYLFFRLVQAVGLLSGQGSTIATNSAYMLRALADIDEESDERLPKALSLDPAKTGLPVVETRPPPQVDDVLPAIEMTEASFRYPGNESWALKDFSFSVRPGECIGVTGPSGCGKSTLVQLVLGVVAPTTGAISVGGRDTRKIQPIEHLRIGYVGAEPFLFEGTVAENLRYGQVGDGGGEWDALTAARLADFVRGLPRGLETMLGEGGDGLSAGQKQRLSLARALLGKPQLLVLDEATANLDNATEAEVAESLSALAGKVTMLIIAHRPGILAHCNGVIRMAAP